MRKQLLFTASLLALAEFAAQTDEGMWTYNRYPSAKVGAAYGVEPGAEWLKRLQLASVRIAGGCLASVVSPSGLVMTNHLYARKCIQNLSGLRIKDFNKDGFIARKHWEEPRCPGMEMNQLTAIREVTQAMQDATKGATPERLNDV